MLQLSLIALCGAIGALTRYGLSRLCYNLFGDSFAWGTFTVNMLGCFLLGLIMTLTAQSGKLPPELRTGLTVGFLGALTTFSTFSYETFKYIEQTAWPLAAANIVSNVLLGLAATFVGVIIARTLTTGA